MRKLFISPGQYSAIDTRRNYLAHRLAIIGEIEGVTDNNLKHESRRMFLAAINEHHGDVGAALREDINCRTKIRESKISRAASSNHARNKRLGNGAMIALACCFPVAAGSVAFRFVDPYVFATFVTIVLYGVLIALYFAQANGPSKTREVFTKVRKDY
jgi:hypothetical protein